MVLAFMHHTMVEYGGIERVLADRMNYLANYGFNVVFITLSQKRRPFVYKLSPKIKTIDLNLPYYQLFQKNLILRFYSYWSLRAKSLFAIKSLIYRYKIDIITLSDISLLFPMLIIDHLRKYVVTVVESHVSKNNIFLPHAELNRSLLRRIYYSMLYHYSYRVISRCYSFVTLTYTDAQDWNAGSKTVVIPNMLSFNTSVIGNQYLENKIVLAVGRLCDQKGFDLLLHAWYIVHSTHCDWKLNIYGDGVKREQLVRLIDELNLNDVVCLNYPVSNIETKYSESNIFVLSSRYEGFGLVLIEAMSCGLPCVSFDCPNGPKDIINNGEDGILVSNDDIKGLAEAIIYLIENESIRKEMGLKARDNVKRYLPENIMPEWIELYQRLSK